MGCCIAALFFNDFKAINSIVLGSVFSLMAINQLERDQFKILIQKNKKFIFISFIFRLCLLALPIIIALKYIAYFKFWIVLLFLFSSQLIFIINELIKNYFHYKKRMDEDG